MDYPTCPDCQRYKEAAFQDAIEFSKFRTMLQIADDQLTALRAENERLTNLVLGEQMLADRFADELEARTAENERLREALERVMPYITSHEHEQIARAALQSKGD